MKKLFLLLLCNSLFLGCIAGILAQPAQDEAAQNERDIRSLESGQVMKRELASGQKHLYRVKLDAGQYLKVVIEQAGIDVGVEVRSPDSSTIFKINNEIRLQGREEIKLVAESAGEYRLAVLPAQKNAPPGSYQIGIVEMRPATENDRALYEAHKMLDVARKLRDAGEYERAPPLFERVIEIRQRVLGPNDSELAYALHGLAVLYYYQGDYLKVEPLEKRALAILEKALGPDHYDVAASLNLLSLLYFYRGDYPKAEQLSARALAIREKSLGSDHPSLTFYLENLARVYFTRGYYAKAEPLYRKALTIREKALGPDHQWVAQLLNDLATLYYKKGDDAQAELLNQRALAIREKALGPEHPKVAESLGNLANIYRDRKDYQRAEPLYRRALAIQEKTLGPLRPHVKSTLDNLAEFYAAKGDIAQAIAVQSRANDVGEYNLSYNIAGGSERQKLAFLDRFSEQTDFTLSLHSLAAPNDPEALKLAFTTLLRRKGRGLDVMTDTIATLRRHATPEDRSLFDQLAEARSQLAALSLGEAGGDGTARLRLKKYEDKVENLEAELSTRSAQFRAQRQPVTLQAVQAALPAGSALIEFVIYTPRNPRTRESLPPRYLAYLLTPRGQPKWTDLGEAGPINQAVNAWRRALRDPRRLDVKRLARSMDEKIMRPVRASIRSDGPGGIRHLLISPDGLLNLIPFAALVDEQRHYLVERYTISYLTSGRELLRLPATAPSGSDPLVVASPAFNKNPGAVARGTHEPGKV
ncbi:MAG: tetratricopeptide repeat protein, partial [Blastocatellia bacterium]|nr:tetratricopeptide repeat protein [Blastocatellia bacterium]